MTEQNFLCSPEFDRTPSAGKCVAAMISPPRQHTSCSSQVISASASTAYRGRMPWILEHPCDSWLCDVPKIEVLAAQPRTAWALADHCIFGSPSRKRSLILFGNVDSRDLHRVARKCAGTGRRCIVTVEKDVLHVTTPALFRLSFALCPDLHHERTTNPGVEWDLHCARILVWELLILRLFQNR